MSKVEVPLSRYNYLLHPYQATMVTCVDKNGEANIITIAWIMPVSLNPPVLALSMRPTRYSHRIIKETGEFVVNIPTYQLVRQVLYCGRVSGREVNKFKETRLTVEESRRVKVPRIKECKAHLECKVREVMKIGDHDLFLAEVVLAEAKRECLTKEGIYNLEAMKPLLHIGKNWFTTTAQVEKEQCFFKLNPP